MSEDWMYEIDEEGRTPMTRALECGHPRVVELIVSLSEEGADSGGGPELPLHLAARNGRVAEVREHIEQGADMDEADDHGLTPLHWAALNGCLDLAKLLVNRGAGINEPDVRFTGLTPMEIARLMGYRELVQFLATQGGA